jgi:hypothetical protein
VKKLPVGEKGPQQEQPGSLDRALAFAQGHDQPSEISQNQEDGQFHGSDYGVHAVKCTSQNIR